MCLGAACTCPPIPSTLATPCEQLQAPCLTFHLCIRRRADISQGCCGQMLYVSCFTVASPLLAVAGTPPGSPGVTWVVVQSMNCLHYQPPSVNASLMHLRSQNPTHVLTCVCRYMTAMHQSPAEGEGGEEAPYEVLLFELLGPEKVHFVHLIHKLLMLENQTFLQ